MQKLKELKVYEYKYDTEEERNEHVKIMEERGYECSGQVKRSDDSLLKANREYYWFAYFSKYICD